MMRLLIVAIGLIAALPAMVFPGEADVTGVEVRQTASGIYHFDVTVRHDDTGWDHYADQWEVLAPDGTVLGTRTLYHPHVGEQPFTRSLSGVAVAETIVDVTVRAHDSVHAYGGKTQTVGLPR